MAGMLFMPRLAACLRVLGRWAGASGERHQAAKTKGRRVSWNQDAPRSVKESSGWADRSWRAGSPMTILASAGPSRREAEGAMCGRRIWARAFEVREWGSREMVLI